MAPKSSPSLDTRATTRPSMALGTSANPVFKADVKALANEKLQQVIKNPDGAVKNAKGGQVQFRADKTGIVQCTIGRASFTPEQLRDNLGALLDALNKAKPAATKGVFLRKVSVSSTMGLGVKVDPSSATAAA